MITVQYLPKIIGITIKALNMQPSYYQISTEQDGTVQCLLKITK